MQIEKNCSLMNIETVYLDDNESSLVILDQTLLPEKTVYLHLKSQEEIWEAIYELRVRGAPAIGITAAFGVYLGAKALDTDDYDCFYEGFMKLKSYLASSRPTAVNLFWALNRMEACAKANKGKAVVQIIEALKKESEAIKEEDIEVCRKIGEYGLELLKPGMGILTHCNAGQLAAARYGTALAPIYLGHEKGYAFKVFADETRPLLQGARLTAYELNQAGVDVTLICDNMASTVMQKGWIQAVFVGCDRVAANGDVVNKIGTSGVAILARNYGIPFYVCAPTSTIDITCRIGKDVNIEERKPDEITDKWYTKSMAPKGVKAYNPAFDITEGRFVTGLVTEYGVIRAPYIENIRKIQVKSQIERSCTIS